MKRLKTSSSELQPQNQNITPSEISLGAGNTTEFKLKIGLQIRSICSIPDINVLSRTSGYSNLSLTWWKRSFETPAAIYRLTHFKRKLVFDLRSIIYKVRIMMFQIIHMTIQKLIHLRANRRSWVWIYRIQSLIIMIYQKWVVSCLIYPNLIGKRVAVFSFYGSLYNLSFYYIPP